MSNHGDLEWSASLRRRLRLIVLLESAENAGLIPLSVMRLHTFAYLSNVLAPVWDMPAMDGRVLKRRGGPFYPSLQHDLDRLVGMGVVLISGIGYSHGEDQLCRLEGSYRLHRSYSAPILESLLRFKDEAELIVFVQELAYALSGLSDTEIDGAMVEDATYSDPIVDFGNVLDFGEWRQVNYSSNSALAFDRSLPDRIAVTAGEKLHFYVRHLRKRLHGGH